jgi:hypothetical protein
MPQKSGSWKTTIDASDIDNQKKQIPRNTKLPILNHEEREILKTPMIMKVFIITNKKISKQRKLSSPEVFTGEL